MRAAAREPKEVEDDAKACRALGASLLQGSASPLLAMARQIALTHHERWEGSGYPQGLRGEEIPLVRR